MVRMTAHVESITYKVERWFETVVFGEALRYSAIHGHLPPVSATAAFADY
jgi:hypothetical protein